MELFGRETKRALKKADNNNSNNNIIKPFVGAWKMNHKL